jgi:hypothetical protein
MPTHHTARRLALIPEWAQKAHKAAPHGQLMGGCNCTRIPWVGTCVYESHGLFTVRAINSVCLKNPICPVDLPPVECLIRTQNGIRVTKYAISRIWFHLHSCPDIIPYTTVGLNPSIQAYRESFKRALRVVEHTSSLIPIRSVRCGQWRRKSPDFLVEDGKAYDRQCSRARLQVCWHKVETSLRDIYSPLAELPSHHLLRARIVLQLYNDSQTDASRPPITTVLPHLPSTRTTQAADLIHSPRPRQDTTHNVH